ncbi:hypothetical protein HMPREF0262_03307 [Clostridium sp. ATCC 29733]|nr:hypothetical protein HMPREF0262_03307 [Clostridium sp. ATCC 29733]
MQGGSLLSGRRAHWGVFTYLSPKRGSALHPLSKKGAKRNILCLTRDRMGAIIKH